MLDTKVIEGLIEENDLNAALSMLKDWAGSSHSEVRREVIILKGRLTEIRRRERLELANLEEILYCKSKLAYAILSLLEEVTDKNI